MYPSINDVPAGLLLAGQYALSITKSIVEHYGGGIGVESKKGEGSTFYFTLPAGVEYKEYGKF